MADPFKFEVPDRCLLRQALVWVSRKVAPVPDTVFLAAPGDLDEVDLKNATSLIRLLRLGKFDVTGRVVFGWGAGRGIDEKLHIDREYRPAPHVLSEKNIDFSNSRVNVTEDVMNALTGGDFMEAIAEKINDADILERGRVWLEGATLPTKTLFECFPRPAPDGDAQRQSTIGAQNRCEKWLVDLMEQGGPEQSKKDYYVQAKEKEPNLSWRAFDRAWGNAVSKTNNKSWSMPGRKASRKS